MGPPTRVSALCHQVPLSWGAEVRQEHAGAGRPWGLRNWRVHALSKGGSHFSAPATWGQERKVGPESLVLPISQKKESVFLSKTSRIFKYW